MRSCWSLHFFNNKKTRPEKCWDVVFILFFKLCLIRAVSHAPSRSNHCVYKFGGYQICLTCRAGRLFEPRYLPLLPNGIHRPSHHDFAANAFEAANLNPYTIWCLAAAGQIGFDGGSARSTRRHCYPSFTRARSDQIARQAPAPQGEDRNWGWISAPAGSDATSSHYHCSPLTRTSNYKV